jgi:hypothetical protein
MITTTTLHHRSLILARNLISHGRIACTSTFPYSSSSNLPLKDDPKLTEVAQFVDEYLPTEKTSLSRGLVLDKFEKVCELRVN